MAQALDGNRAVIAGLLIFLLTLNGCTLLQVAPIQLARISQTEHYQQRFLFADRSSPQCAAFFDELAFAAAQTRCVDSLFTRLLGKANWQKLKDLYGLAALRDEIINGDIRIDGNIDFTLYVDPRDHRQFSVEGGGRYFLIRGKTGAILLAGDFQITPALHRLADLDRGALVLDVQLYVSRIPGQITYLHRAPLKYRIFIDNSMKADGLYRIDYRKTHQAFLTANRDDLQAQRNQIAELTLAGDGKDIKLFDLRALPYLQGDYDEILRQRAEPAQ